MSRLLFAAARGARIQSRWYDSLQWQTSGQFVFIDTMRHYRIHPADEHLQYGPISTELRAMAADASWKPCPYRVLANVAANKFQVYLGGIRDDYPLFYLILAEFLADEGM
jgi:hypothetical protein